MLFWLILAYFMAGNAIRMQHGWSTVCVMCDFFDDFCDEKHLSTTPPISLGEWIGWTFSSIFCCIASSRCGCMILPPCGPLQRHTHDVLENCKNQCCLCITTDTFVSSKNIEALIAESDSALKSDTET
jgi:hypothetical protein